MARLVDDAAERTLAMRAARGDAQAFRAILSRYQARLWRMAWRAAGDRASAEDLFQEVAVKLHRALPTYREEEPLGPFLHRIAVNAACDFVRRRAARPRGEVIPLDLAASGPDPEAAVQDMQRARRLRALLADLPDEQREVLVLRHYGELSYEEIAEATGRPLGTVKTLIHRGRARLRAALGEGGEEAWTASGSRSC